MIDAIAKKILETAKAMCGGAPVVPDGPLLSDADLTKKLRALKSRLLTANIALTRALVAMSHLLMRPQNADLAAFAAASSAISEASAELRLHADALSQTIAHHLAHAHQEAIDP